MDYSKTVASLTPHMIEKIKTAIELGKWENGDKMTEMQLESAMQAVMLWEAQNKGNSRNEPFVIGSDGELFTGKGESHKLTSSPKIDENSIITKTKA